jgi:hypothetical protein
MASIYIPANADVLALVKKVAGEWHPDLIKAQAEFGVLLVLAASETQPAVKENGHAVEGTIKIVAPKDRITKKFDVEILLDGDEWKTDREEHKVAKIDHLLSRLEVKKPRPKKKKGGGAVHGSDEEREAHQEAEFAMDDYGRPQLKLRKGDWNVGYGFADVVKRHGNFAPEVKALDKARAVVDYILKEKESE